MTADLLPHPAELDERTRLPSAARSARREFRSSMWPWARLLVGAAILGFLVWRLGTGPFLQGVRMVDARSLAAAATIGALTTACCAWRWRLVARGLGAELRLPTAVAAYYRSQFLNTVLPGGVLGDVHRGVRHGRTVDDVGRGLRAVGWERTAGQVIQATLAFVVLVTMPSPVQSSIPAIAAVVFVVGAMGVVLLYRARPQDRTTRWARARRTVSTDVRDGLLARRAWPGIVIASAVVVVGHAVTFLIAARTAAVSTSPTKMLPLALLVLLSMSVPANIGGWGPREGVAAWAFAAAGLTADQGVATAVVYGVMVIVASLPGAIVMLAAWLRGLSRHPDREDDSRLHPALTGAADGAGDGG